MHPLRPTGAEFDTRLFPDPYSEDGKPTLFVEEGDALHESGDLIRWRPGLFGAGAHADRSLHAVGIECAL